METTRRDIVPQREGRAVQRLQTHIIHADQAFSCLRPGCQGRVEGDVVGVCAEFGFARRLFVWGGRGRRRGGTFFCGQSEGSEGNGGEMGVPRGKGGERTVVLGVADDAVVVVGVHVVEDAGGGVVRGTSWSAFGVGMGAWMRHVVVLGSEWCTREVVVLWW